VCYQLGDAERAVLSLECRRVIGKAQTEDPCIQTLTGHTDWVNSVAFSPNGQQIVSGADDKSVRLWDVAVRARARPDLQPLATALPRATATAWFAFALEWHTVSLVVCSDGSNAMQ
jgi:WD40 repeat protein